MQLAQHPTVLCAWYTQCLLGRRKRDVRRPDHVTVWTAREVSTACPWTPHARPTDAPRTDQVHPTECRRTVLRLSEDDSGMSHEYPYELEMDAPRHVHGHPTDAACTPHGLFMGIPNTPHGHPTEVSRMGCP